MIVRLTSTGHDTKVQALYEGRLRARRVKDPDDLHVHDAEAVAKPDRSELKH